MSEENNNKENVEPRKQLNLGAVGVSNCPHKHCELRGSNGNCVSTNDTVCDEPPECFLS
jgi:hypothetical protein